MQASLPLVAITSGGASRSRLMASRRPNVLDPIHSRSFPLGAHNLMMPAGIRGFEASTRIHHETMCEALGRFRIYSLTTKSQSAAWAYNCRLLSQTLFASCCAQKSKSLLTCRDPSRAFLPQPSLLFDKSGAGSHLKHLVHMLLQLRCQIPAPF